ncbi:MAG: hypothetical protein ACYC9R_12710 [Nitrosotalea sp.]
MATSGVAVWSANRAQVIDRALRIVGAIAQGETPDASAVTEANVALNDIIKAWGADGMALWTLTNYSITPVLNVNSYTIGSGGSVNQIAPLKVIQGFRRTTLSGVVTDSPMIPISRYDYNLMGVKASAGPPSQYWYNPPGNMGSGQALGTATLYPTPDAYTVANCTIILVGQTTFQDETADADVIDFPSYWNDALSFGLASALAFEYKLPLQERSMIASEAKDRHDLALSFGTEEGSIFFQPRPRWEQ